MASSVRFELIKIDPIPSANHPDLYSLDGRDLVRNQLRPHLKRLSFGSITGHRCSCIAPNFDPGPASFHGRCSG